MRQRLWCGTRGTGTFQRTSFVVVVVVVGVVVVVNHSTPWHISAQVRIFK